jgi:hypothetical protein
METYHGTVLKRVKRNPVSCYVRLDDGSVEAYLETRLRPEPVTIDLATPLYVRGRRKRGKGSTITTSGTSQSAGSARIVSGGRVESKR